MTRNAFGGVMVILFQKPDFLRRPLNLSSTTVSSRKSIATCQFWGEVMMRLKINIFSLVLLGLLVFSSCVEARLGETKIQLIERFGEPQKLVGTIRMGAVESDPPPPSESAVMNQSLWVRFYLSTEESVYLNWLGVDKKMNVHTAINNDSGKCYAVCYEGFDGDPLDVSDLLVKNSEGASWSSQEQSKGDPMNSFFYRSDGGSAKLVTNFRSQSLTIWSPFMCIRISRILA